MFKTHNGMWLAVEEQMDSNWTIPKCVWGTVESGKLRFYMNKDRQELFQELDLKKKDVHVDERPLLDQYIMVTVGERKVYIKTVCKGDKRKCLKDLLNMLKDDAPATKDPTSPDSMSRDTALSELLGEAAEAKVKAGVEKMFQWFAKDGALHVDDFREFMASIGFLLDATDAIKVFEEIPKREALVMKFEQFYKFVQTILGEDTDSAGIVSTLRLAQRKAKEDKRHILLYLRDAILLETEKDRASIYKAMRNIKIDTIERSQQRTTEEDSVFQIVYSDYEHKHHHTGGDGKQLSEKEAELSERLQEELSRFFVKNFQQMRDKGGKEFQYEDWVRCGADGTIVMRSGAATRTFKPGDHALLRMIYSNKLPMLPPKHVKVRIEWKPTTDGDSMGQVIFPEGFDHILPIEVPTNRHLAFYASSSGAPRLVDVQDSKVYLWTRHYVVDFTYNNNYQKNYVKNCHKMGLERHNFCHFDRPMEQHSGYFVIGKIEKDEKTSTRDTERGDLYLTAFKVPLDHALFLPEYVIHSNDYLRGTWRTMLADGVDVDGVQLLQKKTIANHDIKPHEFMFQFRADITPEINIIHNFTPEGTEP